MAALLTLFTLLLVGRLAATEWQSYQRAAASRVAIDPLCQALVAAEMVSREHGPSNGLLGDGGLARAQRRSAVNDARLRTDTAFTALRQVLTRTEGGPRWHDAGQQFAAASAGGHDSIDPAGFEAPYGPDLNTLFKLRDALLARAGARADAEREHEHASATLVMAAGGRRRDGRCGQRGAPRRPLRPALCAQARNASDSCHTRSSRLACTRCTIGGSPAPGGP